MGLDGLAFSGFEWLHQLFRSLLQSLNGFLRRMAGEENQAGFPAFDTPHFRRIGIFEQQYKFMRFRRTAVVADISADGMAGDRATINGGCQMALRTLDAVLTSGWECEVEGVGLGGVGKPVSPKRNTDGQRSD